MTYKEKLKRDRPDMVSWEYCGGCGGCPGDYCNGAPIDEGDCGFDYERCENCWNAEAPDTEENTLKVMLDPGAKMPTRAHSTDAGLDLYSPIDAVVFPRRKGGPENSVVIDTGVHVEIPAGYVGMIKSKSGLNVKHGIISEGVIDSGYTGSICVKLYNLGNEIVHIEKGQKISQLVIMPIITPVPVLVDSLEETERGTGGFGSTGAF